MIITPSPGLLSHILSPPDPRHQDDPYANPKPLKISGPDDAVERAMAQVNELIQDRSAVEEPEFVRDPLGPPSSADIASNLSSYKSVKCEVKVPRFAVGSVIGRAGDTIKRVQAETGARIQFDQGSDSYFSA